jgi:hypothetical protein
LKIHPSPRMLKNESPQATRVGSPLECDFLTQ